MPTPYTEFCEAVKNLTPEEEAWWKHQIDKMEGRFEGDDGMNENDDYEEGFGYEFCTYEGGRHLVIMPGENRENLQRAAGLVQQFLAVFRPNDSWSIEFANITTRQVVGAYGGGAYFVTATRIKAISSWEWLRRQRKAFEKTSRHPSETENGSPSGSA
jgi:hypothetical protein